MKYDLYAEKTEILQESAGKRVHKPNSSRWNRGNTFQLQGWIPKGESIEFAGFTIPGMVYFGIPDTYVLKSSKRTRNSSVFIDPRKKVLKHANFNHDDNLSTHDYGEMSPRFRTNYLEWLATGKNRKKCSVYYPILYFFGLERRFVLDDPELHEKLEIIEEVRRLKRLYGRRFEFDLNADGFIRDIADCFDSDGNVTIHSWKLETYDAIEAMVEHCERSVNVAPLNGRNMLKLLPEILNRKPIDSRYSNHWFESLFLIRFAEYYPNGIVLEPPKDPVILNYEARSREFKKEIQIKYKGKPALKIDDLKEKLDVVRKIASSVADDLAKHRAFVERNPEMSGSQDALKLLPRELWNEFKENLNETDELKSWARNVVDNGAFTTVADVILKTGGRLFNEKTILDRDWDEGRDVLALCGFGTAPDHYLRFRRDRPDEPAVIYELDGKKEQSSGFSNAYRTALAGISICAYLLASKNCSKREAKKLLRKIISDSKGLTKDELKGLKANMECVLQVPHESEFPENLGNVVKGQRKNELLSLIFDLTQRYEQLQTITASAIKRILRN